MFLSLVGLSSEIHAQQQFAQDERRFEISSQPLAEALVVYARIARTEILIDDSLLAGRRSAAISGRLNTTAALRQMLAETDLEIRYVDRSTVTLVRQRSFEPSSDAAADQYASFSVALQAAIARSMCGVGGLSVATRVVAQLWFGPDGGVIKSLLLDSTGEAERDVAITARLESLSVPLSTPPTLPQPATVVFVKRKSSDCTTMRAGHMP